MNTMFKVGNRVIDSYGSIGFIIFVDDIIFVRYGIAPRSYTLEGVGINPRTGKLSTTSRIMPYDPDTIDINSPIYDEFWCDYHDAEYECIIC